jgi:hypothetical protein
VATHFKYGIQRPPWQRHELSSVISLSFLDVYGSGLKNFVHRSHGHYQNHRYRKAKIDCLSFVMCPLLAQLIIGFFSLVVNSTNEANKAGGTRR